MNSFTNTRCIGLSAALLMLAAFAPASVSAGEKIPHSHIAVSAGWALERKKEKDEEAFTLGIDYEYRATELWGFGGTAEWLGDDVVRNFTVVGLVSLHPAGGLRVFTGPGIEFTDKKDKAMLRLGVGYEFHLNERWSLAPEFFGDFIENGERTYVGAIALGYSF